MAELIDGFAEFNWGGGSKGDDSTSRIGYRWGLGGSLAQGLQSSLAAAGVCFIWPSLNGGYWLFNRHGFLITPFMDTEGDSERTQPGDNSED